MTKINNAYINALLADAAYVNLIQGLPQSDMVKALDDRMTERQAQYIANNFEVISAINTNDLMGSGFDAVVWRGRTGSEFAGQVFVSMRGTEPGGMDLLDADADLATRGVAYSQVRDMVNWWMSATTSPEKWSSKLRCWTPAPAFRCRRRQATKPLPRVRQCRPQANSTARPMTSLQSTATAWAGTWPRFSLVCLGSL